MHSQISTSLDDSARNHHKNFFQLPVTLIIHPTPRPPSLKIEWFHFQVSEMLIHSRNHSSWYNVSILDDSRSLYEFIRCSHTANVYEAKQVLAKNKSDIWTKVIFEIKYCLLEFIECFNKVIHISTRGRVLLMDTSSSGLSVVDWRCWGCAGCMVTKQIFTVFHLKNIHQHSIVCFIICSFVSLIMNELMNRQTNEQVTEQTS